jgi:hypothetical protein
MLVAYVALHGFLPATARPGPPLLAGLGGVAPALLRLGISTAAQLQGHSPSGLAGLLGGQQQGRLAGRLAEAGWGRDEARVVDKGPAKSLQVGGGLRSSRHVDCRQSTAAVVPACKAMCWQRCIC